MTALEPQFLEAPAQISGQEIRTAFEGLQEGVVGAGDLKVSAGGGTREVVVAAGIVLIQGDAVTDQGLYRARNDANISSNTSTAGAFEAGGIPAADATNPRIDQIVARIYDASHDGSGQRKWRPEVVAGTATSGATLDNRTGAAALPAGACRLADVLVPAGATTISAGNIRDRRPWARGVTSVKHRSAGSNYFPPTSLTAIDPTNIDRRVELSGVPVRIGLSAAAKHAVANGEVTVALAANGTVIPDSFGFRRFQGRSTAAAEFGIFRDLPWVPPAPGSYVISWQHADSPDGGELLVSGGWQLTTWIEERVTQNADNA